VTQTSWPALRNGRKKRIKEATTERERKRAREREREREREKELITER